MRLVDFERLFYDLNTWLRVYVTIDYYLKFETEI